MTDDLGTRGSKAGPTSPTCWICGKTKLIKSYTKQFGAAGVARICTTCDSAGEILHELGAE